MEFDDYKIKWSCGNWYVREDGFIHISAIDGADIILNQSFSEIWKAIECECTLLELRNKLNINFKEAWNLIESMKKIGIISIIENNEFESIFC